MLGEGRPAIVTRQEAIPLQSFFSIREFGLVERLLLVPFSAGDEVNALLVIARSGMLELSGGKLPSDLAQSALVAASLIRRSRSIASGGSITRSEPAQRLREILNAAGSDKHFVLLVRLELGELVAALPTQRKGTDSFRLRKDIVTVLGSMMTGGGELIPVGSNVLVLSLIGRSLHDERLVLHQICVLLGTLFATPVLDSQLHWRSWSYPKEGCTSDELIAEIIQ